MVKAASHGDGEPCPVTGGPLLLMLGARQGAAEPAVLPESAAIRLRASIDSGARITVMETDGAPHGLGTDAFTSTAKNTTQLEKQRRRFLRGLNTTITAAHAVTAQAAPLQGLQKAADTLHEHAHGGQIIVSDSGLSTLAPLDFTEDGMLDADPTDVVRFLARTGQLPGLNGLSVTFYGLGDVDPHGDQPPLPQPSKDALIAIWTKIADAGGASCVYAIPTPNTASAGAQTVPVDIVTPPPPVVFTPTSTPSTAPTSATRSAPAASTSSSTTTVAPIPPTVALPNDATYGFQPDSDELRHPQRAAAGLEPLINWLTVDANHDVTLTGTTARVGDKSGQEALATARAKTIGRLLIDAGAGSGQITVDGVGSDWPGYTRDHDSDGNLLPAAAQRNRNVLVQPVA